MFPSNGGTIVVLAEAKNGESLITVGGIQEFYKFDKSILDLSVKSGKTNVSFDKVCRKIRGQCYHPPSFVDFVKDNKNKYVGDNISQEELMKKIHSGKGGIYTGYGRVIIVNTTFGGKYPSGLKLM